MQIFYIPSHYIIGLFAAMWAVFQFGAATICRNIKDEHFRHDRSIYRLRNWEKSGKIYERFTKVHRWKKYLPDGASIGKGGFRKKHLASFSRNYIERYLMESCRAELTHWLAIFPFWVFGFFAPPRVILYMFLYAVAVNVPCIIAQRYNRPRMARLLKRLEQKSEK